MRQFALPEANGGGVSASRFAGAGCFTRFGIRATGAGSVSSPRPLRAAVGPKRQARPGKLPLGSFVGADRFARSERRRQFRWCRPLWSKRPESANSPFPIASRLLRIRVQPVSANLPKESGANCRLCVPQTGALSWVQTFHLIGFTLPRAGSMAGLSNPVLSVTHVLGNFSRTHRLWNRCVPTSRLNVRGPLRALGACRQLAERLRLREQKSENQTPCGVSGTVLVGLGCSRRILHRPVVSVSCCLKACGIRALSYRGPFDGGEDEGKEVPSRRAGRPVARRLGRSLVLGDVRRPRLCRCRPAGRE